MSIPASTPAGTGATSYVAAGVLVLVTALLAWDHLFGNEPGSDDAFPVDPATFVLSMVLTIAFALLVFGLLVRRWLRDEGGMAGRYGLILAGTAVVTAPFATWLGIPQVLAGGGLALGLAARRSGRSRAGSTAAALSLVVLVFGIAATAFPAGGAG